VTNEAFFISSNSDNVPVRKYSPLGKLPISRDHIVYPRFFRADYPRMEASGKGSPPRRRRTIHPADHNVTRHPGLLNVVSQSNLGSVRLGRIRPCSLVLSQPKLTARFHFTLYVFARRGREPRTPRVRFCRWMGTSDVTYPLCLTLWQLPPGLGVVMTRHPDLAIDIKHANGRCR